ncbi:MAG: glycosyltransferase family 2 protein, partial [Armatimonadota bacterium]
MSAADLTPESQVAPTQAPYVSVVIPVYNEEANIPELLGRLCAVTAQLGKPTEIILVDDGSADRSVELLRAFVTDAAEIVVVELTRNFGQHAAVMAGFSKARGQVVVVLDADLQNPPEEIPRLIEQFEAGYDVVGTIRRDRDDPFLR